MKLLFLGDVVGQIGSEFVGSKLRSLKQFYGADIVVINGENSANGNGITPQSAKYLFQIGADVITTGNHCYRRKEILDMFDSEDFLIRPANFPEGNAGHGYCVLDMGSSRVAVVNLMGTVYMEALDNPFSTIDRLLGEIDTPNIILDFHAEATSEKIALGRYVEGRASLVFGTHTHVPTADETVLPGGTAYITDIGMCGPMDSVLGVVTKCSTDFMITHLRGKGMEIAKGPCKVQGIFTETDDSTGKALSIERFEITDPVK
jgi:metallophosphoesterase (TIGR00282 family)